VPRFTVPDALARDLCSRLGTPLPSTFDEVVSLYRAWCARLPFDNVAKSIALLDGTTPPGADAVEVIERWMETGIGSTCWGHCTAFAGMLGVAGIDSRVAVDRMVRDDDVVDFHSFVVADIDGSPWAFDHIHVTERPLRLEAGEAATFGAYAAGFRRDDGRLVHWFANPERPGVDGRYVVLAADLDLDDVRAFCQISRQFTGVRSGRLFSRRFPASGMVHGRPADDGTAIEVRRWSGTTCTTETIVDPDAALAALGYPLAARALVERAGMVSVVDGSVRWATGPAT